jgi:hypothetical protein
VVAGCLLLVFLQEVVVMSCLLLVFLQEVVAGCLPPVFL